MLKDKLRRILLGGPAASKPPSGETPPSEPAVSAPREADPIYSRHSHGLDQFFARIQDQSGLTLLDLGGINQPNVSFITSLGHRIYSEDFLRSTASGGPEALGASLDFPQHSLDGVLLWDVLEFLPPPALKEAIDRLHDIVKPGCCLLSFFHAEEKTLEVPCYSYRISDAKTLFLAPRGARAAAQLFNNRGIEKLFQDFHSVKFFLARDHLREVIVTR